MGFMACPHGPLTNVDSSALVTTGSRYKGVAGDEYIYLKGIGSTAAGSWVQFYSNGTDYITALLTETIAENGANVAVALAATVADKYGWYQICGEVEAASLVDNVAGADQFATTTSGSLDDAGTTTIHGVQLIDTVSVAGNATYSIQYPHTNVA